MKRFTMTVASVLLIFGLTACGSDGPSATTKSTQPTTLTVFAAASLKATFTEIGKQFEAEHDGATVRFNFAGSSDLVAQIQQGAPADVFASADTANMAKATADNLVDGTPENFASNTLEIVTAPGNPAKIASFADLAKPGVKVVVCAPAVPCGSASHKVETAAGVDLKPVSEESSVTDVLNKVATGQADAGLVYVTDVKDAGATVTGVPFPESASAVNTYPIGAIKGTNADSMAKQFVAYVLSPKGQAILAEAGFAKP